VSRYIIIVRNLIVAKCIILMTHILYFIVKNIVTSGDEIVKPFVINIIMARDTIIVRNIVIVCRILSV
jgi:hypothetical protein